MVLRTLQKRLCQVLAGVLLWGLPAVGLAKEPYQADSRPDTAPSRQSLGAPQVLEIPPMPEVAPAPVETLPADTAASPPPAPTDDPYAAIPQHDDGAALAPPQEATERRTYLGVMYASTQEGTAGVKVLDVIPGSPAARAGFEGANTPPSQSNELVRTALIALSLSPVGAFAMPLVIMHDMYMASRTPGDLIVAIGDQQVRDASDFGQAMQRYQVGDIVVFSILRNGKPYQISVQLEEEPA